MNLIVIDLSIIIELNITFGIGHTPGGRFICLWKPLQSLRKYLNIDEQGPSWSPTSDITTRCLSFIIKYAL